MRYILWMLFLFPFGSNSQIVNIENQRLDGNRQGFHGGAELNLNFTMNTKQLLQVGDKFRLGYTRDRHLIFVLADHGFVKSQDDNFINKGFEHLRYNYTLKDSGKIVYEAFQQVQFNKIQKINLRFLIGTGMRFKLIDGKNYQLSFGSGFMAEYEELLDIGTSRDILSTSYLSFDGQFSENIGMNSISYLQPKLIDKGQYRFANETYIRFKINKYLNFKLIYSLVHDSRDLAGVRKTNYFIKNSLSFTF